MKPAMRILSTTALLVISVQADVLTPAQQFFGLGGQTVGEEYQDLQNDYRGEEFAPFSDADSDTGVQEVLSPTSNRSPLMIDFVTAGYFTDNAPMAVGPDLESSWLSYSRLSAAGGLTLRMAGMRMWAQHKSFCGSTGPER